MPAKLLPLLIVLLTCVNLSGITQSGFPPDKPDQNLQNKLTELVKNFKGDVGIYVRHLKTGKTAAICADSLFPTASMIKVPIMVGLFDKIRKDILGSFADSAKIAMSKVVMLMITTSDNTASLWCQHLAGTGIAINSWLEQNGFIHTRINSRTPGRQENQKQYGWGQTTPREMAELVVNIREGKAVSPDASERMYRNLTRIYWDAEALSQIPPTVQAASKQGAVDQSRSEVMLVNAPSGDYVFCVITNNQQDESWESTNEGFVLLRNVSRLLWQHFEPKSTWVPDKEAQKWN